MRKLLITALAAASVVGFAGSSFAGAGGALSAHAPAVSMIQKAEWHDCRDWDGRRHECRDKDWDRHHDHSWWGPESCRRHGHDHFLGDDGHWHECHHM
jgi:hypothetical protein